MINLLRYCKAIQHQLFRRYFHFSNLVLFFHLFSGTCIPQNFHLDSENLGNRFIMVFQRDSASIISMFFFHFPNFMFFSFVFLELAFRKIFTWIPKKNLSERYWEIDLSGYSEEIQHQLFLRLFSFSNLVFILSVFFSELAQGSHHCDTLEKKKLGQKK